MKYCSKCGKELFDEAVVCPGCGCAVAGAPAAEASAPQSQPQSVKEESPGLAKSAMIFAFLMPIVGLICGIIGVNKYTDPQLKQKSKSAILASIGMWIAYFFILMLISK